MFESSSSGEAAPRPERVAWAGFEPAGWILDVFTSVPVTSLDDDGVLDRVQALERLRSLVDAEQVVALADFARRCDTSGDPYQPRDDGPDRPHDPGVGDEVGLALRIASADRRIEVAVALRERLPDTLDAMRRGRATLAKARVLLEETEQLAPTDVAGIEDRMLGGIAEVTPGRLRRRVRRAVIGLDPEAATRRRQRAERGREVWLRPDADGMATLGARLCTADAIGIYELLDQGACAARSGGDSRTLDQLRADLLVQIMFGAATPVALRPLVQVLLPAETVTGAGDRPNEPAELVGYGPIDDDLARAIVATGSWQRLLTDPVTGTVTDVGRSRYRPPAALADLVRARGRACGFPTCQRPAARCDLDHRHRWSAGGGTSSANLWPLCGRHHATKDGRPGRGSQWWCDLRRDGSVSWTTPTGRAYSIRPGPDLDSAIDVRIIDETAPKPAPRADRSIADPPPF